MQLRGEARGWIPSCPPNRLWCWVRGIKSLSPHSPEHCAWERGKINATHWNERQGWMSGARRVRGKSKRMKDLLLGFGLLLMRSHKFRWQVMNRKEFCSLSVAHPFPSSRWIKTHLETGRHNHDSTARQGDQMRSLDFNFKFIYDFKGRLNVESRAFLPLFLFRSVTLKYSCPKLGLKKKISSPWKLWKTLCVW